MRISACRSTNHDQSRAASFRTEVKISHPSGVEGIQENFTVR
jgi:hypothetical protein